MVRMAMMIAIVFVATNIRVHIPLGQGGLVHIGTLAMFAIALKYGPLHGALSGGIGMALFDVLSGWAAWAPATLIIRLLAGALVGYLADRGDSPSLLKNFGAIIPGGVVIVAGYFIFETLFISHYSAALLSVPGNLTQIGIGVLSVFVMQSLPDMEEANA